MAIDRHVVRRASPSFAVLFVGMAAIVFFVLRRLKNVPMEEMEIKFRTNRFWGKIMGIMGLMGLIGLVENACKGCRFANRWQ